jgi:ABC-2 type transport system permease protein
MAEMTLGPPSARILAVIRLTLRQILATRRTLVFGLLASLPPALAALFAVLRRVPTLHINATGFDFFSQMMVTFYLHFLLVLIALFYATALIHSEVEEKTITYLLVRPVPKAHLVFAKYLTYLMAAAAILVPSILLTFGILEVSDGASGFMGHFRYLLWDLGVMALGAMAYGAVFVFLGAWLKRPVMVGLFFAVVWEWAITYVPGYFGKLTILHYLLSIFPHSTVQRGVQALFGSTTSRPVAILVLLAIATVFLGLAMETFRRSEYVLEQ